MKGMESTQTANPKRLKIKELLFHCIDFQSYGYFLLVYKSEKKRRKKLSLQFGSNSSKGTALTS